MVEKQNTITVALRETERRKNKRESDRENSDRERERETSGYQCADGGLTEYIRPQA